MGRIACLAALAAGACAGDSGRPAPETAEPAIEVELVGPGTVSTDLPEFATTLSPTGDTIFFNRTPPDRSRLELFYATRAGGVWAAAAPFPPTAGTSAIDPFMSPDGARLYFSSDRPRGGAAGTSFNLWYVERTGGSWSEPRDLGPPVNSDAGADIFNSVASDGTMIFSSTRDGPRRIYATRETDGGWSTPVPLTFGALEEASNPAIGPDGSFIVLSILEPDGPPDLHVSCRAGESWGAPRRLPRPINSDFADFAPGVSGDQLYFTSERPGVVGAQPDSVRPPGDIYRVPLAPVRALCAAGEGAAAG